MSKSHETRPGNVLGDARAEADARMLEEAFVETSDYRALRTTRDFSFVVGRRGTGKTALFLRLQSDFSLDKHVFLHTLKPEEHDSLALVSVLESIGLDSYAQVRPTARVLWRVAMLIDVAGDLCAHWKFGKSSEADWLRKYTDKHRSRTQLNVLQRCTQTLRENATLAASPGELPGVIATHADLSSLESHVRMGLESIGARAVFLFDGLDEGWGPDEVSTGILGGLAIAVASFLDNGIGISAQLFIRDNIFRSLAALDGDFSRHIEGSALRLHWDEESLLDVVANRLRVALHLGGIESNIRVWNRFAHRDLRDRAGFQKCLRHTLYRPRDVLVLLNQAAVRAQRHDRAEVIPEDIDASARQISLDRLADLLKEYESVFPGLRLICANFKGASAIQTIGNVRGQLGKMIDDERYTSSDASDVAVMGTSGQMVDVLYSIGFLGLEDGASGTVRFCHDGAPSSISGIPDDARIALHPCYWRALDVVEDELDRSVLVEIHDDYTSRGNPGAADMRARLLGQLVAELPICPEGALGSARYEDWVLRTCQILFAGNLVNLELHPTPDGVQRRDVVATNEAERGFWKRVLDDFKCRQVVFEAKNFPKLGPDDFRQALSYSGRQFGGLVIIVHRSDEEGLDNQARGWVKEIWDSHETLVLTLPTGLLMRCLRKVRNPERRDYADQHLSRRLDTFQRVYLSQRHGRK